MDWISVITAIGSLATAGGMIATAWQVRIINKQAKLQADQLELQTKLARTQFEDDMTRQYRDIIHKVPVKALLGGQLDVSEVECSLTIFYHYFDLCNEQAFLFQDKRICQKTWETWLEGIRSNFRRPAFKQAWTFITCHQGVEFHELVKVVPELVPQPLDSPASHKMAIGSDVRTPIVL